MKVAIKSFNVKMDVKSSGIEFEVRSPDGRLEGDCYLTMSGLTWCQGKIAKNNGVSISWNNFMTIMSSTDSLKAAVKEAKKHEE